MPLLWAFDESGLSVIPIEYEALALEGPVAQRLPTTPGHPTLILQRVATAPQTWVLISDGRRDVRLNGAPVSLGLAVLSDRDEIRVPGQLHLFFSTEQPARVEPCAATHASGLCPRCKQSIAEGSPAVRCPGCGLWHHASDDLPCWTYAPTCAACAQLTKLDAGYRWTPEDL
jgi:hypothetical protein